MKFNALTFLFLLLAFRLAAFIPDDLPPQFRLLPQPQKIEVLPGSGIRYHDLKSVYLNNTEKRPVMNGFLSTLPLSGSEADGTLTLKLVKDLGLPSPEGYVLQILNKKVVIESSSEADFFMVYRRFSN